MEDEALGGDLLTQIVVLQVEVFRFRGGVVGGGGLDGASVVDVDICGGHRRECWLAVLIGCEGGRYAGRNGILRRIRPRTWSLR